MELAMVDDAIVPIEEAKISAHDRSVYFGDGVYEVLVSVKGKLFARERHMKRLINSLEQMDMRDKVDLEVINWRIDKAMEAAQIPDAKVYFHLSRGRMMRYHDYGEDLKPAFFLTVREFHGRSVNEAEVITHPDWRWKRCDIKSLNLLANVLAYHAARQAGAFEAILVDENGLVTEASSSSVMMIKKDVMQTAPLTANILPGITRGLLLEWAGDCGLKMREKSFTIKEMRTADELILTGTTTQVLGVTKLDGQKIAEGKVGRYTQLLQERLIQAMIE